MALTKVSGSIIKDSVSLSGNVSVGGTLTYQDVTNVDALGIGTFRTGIKVLAGQVDVGSNIKLGNAGVITATSFSGSGANLTGIQVGGASSLSFNDGVGAYFGGSQDLLIYHEGGGGDNIIKNNVANKHLKILHNDGSASAVFYNNTSVALFNSGNKKFETTSSGVSITGGVTASGASTFNEDVSFVGASEDLRFDKSANALEFNDNFKAVFGNGSDFSIYHDGTNSLQFFDAQVGGVRFRTDIGNTPRTNLILTSGVNLYKNNTLMLETFETSSDSNLGGAASGVKTNKTSHTGNHGYYIYHNGTIVGQFANHGTGPEGRLDLYNNGTRKLTMNGTNGTLSLDGYIQFGLTNNSDNHRLDDYEKGDITLTLTGTSGGSANYSYRTGHYTKIGNICHVTGDIRFNGAWSGSTGSLNLGLPFVSEASGGCVGAGIVSEWNLSGSNWDNIMIKVDNNESVARFTAHSGSNNNTSNFQTNLFGNGRYLKFAFTYQTA